MLLGEEKMATVLEIVRGLSQAAANAYDGALDENGELLQVGLNREEGNPILDKRVMDGFGVKFAGDKLVVTYHSEVNLKEVHPRNQFENEIEQKFGDIVGFLKKEYKKVTKNSITLSEVSDADVIVQSTSRVKSFVQATKQYKIGGLDGVEPVRRTSDRDVDKPFEKRFKDFLELSTDKRPSNDKSTKNPDTPEA
tara:strand:+ start:483 stop:1067 length:585 start_codon:yes stop_codon:yes gene_type:complete